MKLSKPCVVTWFPPSRLLKLSMAAFQAPVAITLLGIACSLAGAPGAGQSGAGGSPKSSSRAPSEVSRIPYASLKSQADFQVSGANAEWLLVTDSVLIPDASIKGLRRINPQTNQVTVLPSGVAQACAGATEAFQSLWVPDCADGTIARINPATGQQQAKLATGVAQVPSAITSTADSVWVLTDTKTTLARIDPETNQIIAEMRLPSGCNTVTSSEGALWVTCPSENRVLRIDPERNVVEQRISVSGEPSALAFGEGGFWVFCQRAGDIDRIDPATNNVTKSIPVGLPDSPGKLAVGYGSVWISTKGFPITRIDLNEGRVVQQFSGDAGGVLQLGFNSVWLLNSPGESVSRIDPKRVYATLLN